MEEDSSPVPCFGRHKSLVLGQNGSISGEAPLLSDGRKIVNMQINTLLLCQVPNLSALTPPANVINSKIVQSSCGGTTTYKKMVEEEDCIIYEHVRELRKPPVAKAFLRAGPRKLLHFDPKYVNAAIVTCGSLCPGLNSIIHHTVETLKVNYGVDKIYGIRGGWGGFHDAEMPAIRLDHADNMEFLQQRAGSILGCAPGTYDLDKIMSFLDTNKINQLYVIGGDGTLRGALRVAKECIASELNISVACIPKSVDNDIDLIDRSFGFMTAVEAAQNAIQCANIEAKCNLPNGIGIVKLMGRSTGYLAAYSTMASGDVDLCLVPEVPVEIQGKNSCLNHLECVVENQGYAVVVISEGAGEALMSATRADAIANGTPEPSIGSFMKLKIEEHFASKGKDVTCKYIDPSITVRSVAANAYDQILCLQIAQNAVHGAMAGYTAFGTGVVNNRTVFIPISEIVYSSPRQLNPRGRTWERVLCITRQPCSVE